MEQSQGQTRHGKAGVTLAVGLVSLKPRRAILLALTDCKMGT